MDQDQYYKSTYKQSALSADRQRVDRLSIFFNDSLKSTKILDVGCGPGVQTKFLTEHNDVYGVDISQDALKEADQNGLTTVYSNLDKADIPFENNFFDIIVATDIFEHLFDP
ncbi:uncharacterized protein METZ01_LOCUS256571, partial [marine metagenome]